MPSWKGISLRYYTFLTKLLLIDETKDKKATLRKKVGFFENIPFKLSEGQIIYDLLADNFPDVFNEACKAPN
jgi:hypothetical protein